MDGLEFPDILHLWKMQRGSQQKVAWVWLCSMGRGYFFGLQHFDFFWGAGGSRELLSKFHVGGGRFQKRIGESRG